MKLKHWMLSTAVPTVLGLAVVAAQPPGDEGRPPGPPDGGPPDRRGPDGPGAPDGPRGPGAGRGRPPFPNPLVAALDADRNGEISAEEITGAADALKKLDANEDGKLTPDELRPPGPPPGGPMNPDRFADEALAFDADGDGKLDRRELIQFARTRPGMGGQPGRPGMGRSGRGGEPGGPGGPGGPGRQGRPGRPEGPGGPEGAASERPRRPDAE